MDIRPEYGSNSTILTEYLRLAKIIPSLKLATALFYAIKTDTHNFERPSTEADIRAFHYLFGFTRHALVRSIEVAELTLEMLGYFQHGLNSWQRRQERIYCFVGRVPNPDILVILAEFFLRVIEITWSIVGGVYENRLIVIFRNDGIRKNAGNLAARAFGKLGSTGGHVSSARARNSVRPPARPAGPGTEPSLGVFPHQPDRRTGEIDFLKRNHSYKRTC